MNINEIEKVLAAEPRNVRALILKADHLASAGDARSASSYYLAALKAAGPPQQAPRELLPDLQRARSMYERYAREYQDYIVKQLTARGFDAATSSKRFAQSVDIVLGRKRIYLQEPRYYYFPGLPQIQFYEREPFPWLEALERETDAICAELQGVMEQPAAFAPYVQAKRDRPPNEQAGMLNNPAWSAFYLWKNGEVVAENAARCPRTMQALQDAPLARVPNRSPSILFSLLQPGAHIPPHNGLVNTRLICHLPLIVPGQCTFRVGNELRDWRKGAAWLFDDTIPELSHEERALVVSLFESIDAHGGGRKPEWEI